MDPSGDYYAVEVTMRPVRAFDLLPAAEGGPAPAAGAGSPGPPRLDLGGKLFTAAGDHPAALGSLRTSRAGALAAASVEAAAREFSRDVYALGERGPDSLAAPEDAVRSDENLTGPTGQPELLAAVAGARATPRRPARGGRVPRAAAPAGGAGRRRAGSRRRGWAASSWLPPTGSTRAGTLS